MAIASGCDIGDKLVKAGLIPENTRRIVIDIQADACVMIFYETYADKETFDVVIESLIANSKGIQVKSVSEIT